MFKGKAVQKRNDTADLELAMTIFKILIHFKLSLYLKIFMNVFIILSKNDVPEENVFYEPRETIICLLSGDFALIYKNKRSCSLLDFKSHDFESQN